LDIRKDTGLREKKKLTDIGFWFFGIGITLVFSLDIWIRLIYYQSTSGTKIYPQGNVNKSRISPFLQFGIYRRIGRVPPAS